MFRKDPLHVYRAEALAHMEWLDHGFGTRLSDGWVPGPLASVKQVHSARWIEAAGDGCLGEADALITAVPGLYVSVRTADCVPVLIADERHRAVAAVHAGWRGSADAIVLEVLKAMAQRYGSVAADLAAAIGPAVCGNCYEVGPDVAARFARWFPERSDLNSRAKLDLVEANRRQLLAAGLKPRAIHVVGGCTSCQTEMFFSHRASQGHAGRMMAVIGIKPSSK
jgi:YfiH family protein